MSKLVQLSRRFFNDGEILDVLRDKKISQRLLQKFAKNHGVVSSPKQTVDQLAAQLVRAPFSLGDVNQIAEILETPPRQHNNTTCIIPAKSDEDSIKDALNKLKAERTTEEGETYEWNKRGEVWEVRVKYVDFDPSKTSIYQRTQDEVVLELSPNDENISVQHSHTKRSQEIVEKLSGKIQNKPADQTEELVTINLSGILDPVLRTEFFTSIPKKMASKYRLIDVLDVKVHRAGEAPKTEEDEVEEDELEDPEEHIVKSKIKSAALHGEGILETDLYKDLRDSGYYLTKFVWSSEDLDGDGLQIVTEASFDDDIQASGFVYQVKKVNVPREGKYEGKTSKEVIRKIAPSIENLIMKSAYESQKEIEEKAKERKSS